MNRPPPRLHPSQKNPVKVSRNNILNSKKIQKINAFNSPSIFEKEVYHPIYKQSNQKSGSRGGSSSKKRDFEYNHVPLKVPDPSQKDDIIMGYRGQFFDKKKIRESPKPPLNSKPNRKSSSRQGGPGQFHEIGYFRPMKMRPPSKIKIVSTRDRKKKEKAAEKKKAIEEVMNLPSFEVSMDTEYLSSSSNYNNKNDDDEQADIYEQYHKKIEEEKSIIENFGEGEEPGYNDDRNSDSGDDFGLIEIQNLDQDQEEQAIFESRFCGDFLDEELENEEVDATLTPSERNQKELKREIARQRKVRDALSRNLEVCKRSISSEKLEAILKTLKGIIQSEPSEGDVEQIEAEYPTVFKGVSQQVSLRVFKILELRMVDKSCRERIEELISLVDFSQ